MWGGECKVWSVGCKVWSVGWKVWSVLVKCGVWSEVYTVE